MIKIAVDATGGDFAPEEIVKGAVAAAVEHGIGIMFVGRQDAIKKELDKYDISKFDIEIIHTDEYITADESPVSAFRKKKEASVIQCVNLVRDGKADAVISAGATGGILISAIQILGTFEGISRPAFGGPFPGFDSKTILLDLGSNTDCRPCHLLDYAILGTVYAVKIMGIPNPTVSLAGIGKEADKGNKVTKEAYQLLKKSGLNFTGYIEGNEIVSGKANVVICDGFLGNILLKFNEGLIDAASAWFENKLSPILPADELAKITADFKDSACLTLSKGGILLGVNGVVCKAHGRSKSKDISNTILIVKKAVESGLIDKLKTGLPSIKSFYK